MATINPRHPLGLQTHTTALICCFCCCYFNLGPNHFFFHEIKVRKYEGGSIMPCNHLFFLSHGCIYTKMEVSTSSMIPCLLCHVTWIVLHAWLHYGISIKTMHFDHCQLNREVECINCPIWIGVLSHILLYLKNKSMKCGHFWNKYKSINFLLYGTLFNSYSW